MGVLGRVWKVGKAYKNNPQHLSPAYRKSVFFLLINPTKVGENDTKGGEKSGEALRNDAKTTDFALFTNSK